MHDLNQFMGVVLKLTMLGITHLFKFGETKNQSLSLQERTQSIAATYKRVSQASE